jgi:hypothetical protein
MARILPQMLNDATLDERALDVEIAGERFRGTVAELVRRIAPAAPSDGVLLRAARRDAARLSETARWILLEDVLCAAGLSRREVVGVALRGVGSAYGFAVDEAIVAGMVREAGEEEIAEDLCEEALAEGGPKRAAVGALEVLARAGKLAPHFEALIGPGTEGPALRAIVEALPAARRDAVIARALGEEADTAASARALWVVDLAGPELRARMAEMAPEAAMRARIARGEAARPAPLDAEGLSAAARAAFEERAASRREERARQQLDALARSAHARVVRVLAPALASEAAWREAGAPAREAAGRAVAGRSQGALRFVEVRAYVDLPIAVLRHEATGTLFSLVPGGSFARGLSAAEEAALRDRGAAGLLARIETMRPVAEVCVGPVLVAQEAPIEGPASMMAMFLEEEPFRLLSEAEWERLARGDRRGELCAYGAPSEALIGELAAAGPDRANAFGLWGMGLVPELCADVWHGSHAGAPERGAPRWGEGPRVVRGGAFERGAWDRLCSAARSNQDEWPIVAARPALGVEIG